MRFELPAAVLESLLACQDLRPAEEVCGILPLQECRASVTALSLVPLPNRARRRSSAFRISRIDLLAAIPAPPFAIFHTHPDGPAGASLRDLNMMRRVSAYWLIYSPSGSAAYRSWQGRVRRLPLLVPGREAVIHSSQPK